jgi:hypothetical protein
MADLNSIESASTTKIVGADTSGVETTPVKVSPNQDLGTSDILTIAATSGTLALTTVASEGKVGASPLVNRKYFIMEALDTNVKWGFSSGSQPFDLFKSQLIMIPMGPGISVWFKMSTGTGNVAIAELS